MACWRCSVWSIPRWVWRCLRWGRGLLPPVETALITALDAPLAPVWVWLVFGEVIRRETLLGGAIVFAAVLVHLVRHTRRGAAR